MVREGGKVFKLLRWENHKLTISSTVISFYFELSELI